MRRCRTSAPPRRRPGAWTAPVSGWRCSIPASTTPTRTSADPALRGLRGRDGPPDDRNNPAGRFPTAKVVGGYDFTGSGRPAARAPRTRTRSTGLEGGHGTHVADIIAGQSLAAPTRAWRRGDADAVKVCSDVSSSCNGIALLKGMDFALDPNGDSDLSDAVDVINMSLGTSYGERGRPHEAGATPWRSAWWSWPPRATLPTGLTSSGRLLRHPGSSAWRRRRCPAQWRSHWRSPRRRHRATLEHGHARLGARPLGFNGAVKRQRRRAEPTASPARRYWPTLRGKVALVDRGSLQHQREGRPRSERRRDRRAHRRWPPGDAQTFSTAASGSNCTPSLVITQARAT